MSWRSDSSQLFAGKWTSSLYAGLGIQAQNIPSTGESGASILYNDIAAQGAAPTDEFMAELLTAPAAGNFRLYEDGSFEFTGAPDGVDTFTYRGRRNGVVYGDYTVTMNIGAQAATVAFTMPQMTVAVSANVSAPGNSATVSFTMPQMQVDCSADVQSAGVSANIAFTMPQMVVSATASSAAPEISATISFTMPQMSVYVLSGEFNYYSSAGTSIETVAASTHIEYTL